MVGGAADLVESTRTVFEGGGEFSHVHVGRNVPFGIREHGMGAIVNGAAAPTAGIVKPYGSTFLMFSDYMRGSVRLSALMEPAGAVGVDARLGRPRRGRSDPSAGRALRGAARDPQPVGDPARRRQRDVGRRGGWRSSAPTGRWRCCSRARTSRSSTAPRWRRPTGWSSGGYVLWDCAAAASPELILISTGCGGPARRSTPPAALADGGIRDAGRLDAVHRAVRGPDRGVPRERAARARCAPGWRSSRGRP